jgi:alanyl aminopeptidase
MFERYLGPGAFQAGLRLYLERHRFGSGTSGDLLAALEEKSGKRVAAAFSSFLEQPGVPNVTVALECEAGAPPRLRLQQSRYAPLGSGISPDAQWQLPVCVRHAGVSEPQEQCLLLDAREAVLPLEQRECPGWVFPNARASGYYRWSLSERDFTTLLQRGYGQLASAERLSLLSNTDAAARAGALPLEVLLKVALQVGKEPERELLTAALDVLDGVREALLGEPELPAYRRTLRELLGARQKQLGLFPAAGEPGDRKLLRAKLVSTLALDAREPQLRRELGSLGRALLGLGQDERTARLSSELIEVALAVAVQEGGKPVMERARATLVASNDGIERGRLLGALGQNLDPELSPFVLDLSLAPELRTNERLGLVLAQVRNPETRQRAYAWVERSFDALVAQLGPELGARVGAVAGAFCQPQQAERARTFLAPRVEELTGGPRILRLSVEGAQACAAFASAQGPGARAYFAARAQ